MQKKSTKHVFPLISKYCIFVSDKKKIKKVFLEKNNFSKFKKYNFFNSSVFKKNASIY